MKLHWSKINNILLFGLVLFSAYLFVGTRSDVSSNIDLFNIAFNQSQTTTPTPSPTGTATEAEINNPAGILINKKVKVDFELKSYDVLFGSDGNNSSANSDQIASFTQAGLSQIPIPLSYNIREAYAELPGEVVYGAIRKPNGSIVATCNAKDANTSARNDNDCLYYVTASSIFAEVSLSRASGDPKQKLAIEQGISVAEAVSKLLNNFLVPSTVTDQGRDTLGTLSMWGSDEVNSLVTVRTPQGNRTVFNQKVSVERTGVNRDEGLFTYEFSNTLIPSTLRPLDSTSLNENVGISTLNNPFLLKKSTPNGTVGLNFIIQDYFKNILGDTSSASTQKRLAVQVPIRGIKETNESGVSYNFCEATKANEGKADVNGKVLTRKEMSPDIYPVQYLPTTDPNATPIPDPDSDRAKFERLSSEQKKCLNDIAVYQGKEQGKSCADAYIRGEGCQEETVEESKLVFGPEQQSYPFGLGAYFQNAVLNTYSGTSEGPYLNYLSPYYCSKLTVLYNVKPAAGADYIYKWSSGSSGQNFTRKTLSTNTGNSTVDLANRANNAASFAAANTLQYTNEYCVVGSLLSNFSWTLMQQQNYFSNSQSGDAINMPIEGLTCDKKEIAMFGGSPVEGNRLTTNGELIYKNEDNKSVDLGRGLVDAEDVLITQGYSIYSLNRIIKDELKTPIQKYQDNDIKVISDNNGTPKYVLVSQQMKKGDTRSSFLCSLNQNSNAKKLGETTTGVQAKKCVKIETSNDKIETGKVAYVNSGDTETITIVGYDGSRTLPLDENAVIPSPDIFVHFVDIKSGDVANAIISRRKLSVFRNTIDAIQLTDNKVGVLLTSYEDGGKIKDSKFHLIDPISKYISPASVNLCSGEMAQYCAYMSKGTVSSKLVAAPNGGMFTIIMGNGLGIVLPTNNDFLSKILDTLPSSLAGVFAYQTRSGSFTGGADQISAAKYSGGEFHIFMGMSGYYIKVSDPISLGESRYKELAEKCGANNCLLAVQEEFNPNNFKSDCSNYYGQEGICNYPKLSKLGQPSVFEFEYGGPNNIRAWYTYPELDQTILYSPDLRFSYTGVYGKVNGAEYSNVYVPQIKGQEITALPVRYYNYGQGGLQVGFHVTRDKDGYMTPLLSVLKPERYRCYQNFAKVTDVDPLYGQKSDSGVNLNPANTIVMPGNNNSNNSNGGLTNGDPGGSCEESWCVDDVNFDFGPKDAPEKSPFYGDNKNEELRETIFKYIGNQTRTKAIKSAAQGDYSKYRGVYGINNTICNGYLPNADNQSADDKIFCKMNYICEKSAARGVSCAFMMGLWNQESTMEMSDEPTLRDDDPVFGCFGRGYMGDLFYTFPNQVDCALDSIRKSIDEYYAKGASWSGPGATFTPNVGMSLEEKTGSCKPATRFSMVMQRYTPTDKRINYDNQCNNGLILRDDQGSENNGKNCDFSVHVPDYVSEPGLIVNDRSSGTTSLKWPTGNLLDSRISLRVTLEKLDPKRFPVQKNCYANNGQTTNPSVGSTDIKGELAKYTRLSQTGSLRMDLAAWGSEGKSAPAANVKMVMDYKLNSTAKGLLGVHVVAPGTTFSFNDTIGNASEADVKNPEIEAKLRARGYDVNNAVSNPGYGWCELATAIRTAADKMRTNDGAIVFKESLFESTTTNKDRENETTVYAPKKGHTGFQGYDGDIKNYRHNSGVVIEGFNKLIPQEDNGDIDTVRKYVLIWTQPGTEGETDGYNDADLQIYNPTDKNLIIGIYYDDDAQNMIKIETFLGEKK